MGINRSYWRAREEAQRLLDMRSDAAREREYSTLYKRAFDDIQKEIDAFFSRYATKEGISIAEAHKRVSRLDIEAYSRKAEAYVEEKNFTKQANEEMRLYNLAMKVNRLEMLKSKIALELAAKGSAEERHLKSTLDDAARKELERLSGILGDTVKHDADPKLIQKIVEGDFHNATYSQRIWNNNKLLQLAIEKELQTSLVQGRRPDYKKLAQLFDASEYAAKRLLHTETKRVRTEAAKERYLENDIGEYEYMALGPNPCPICSDLNGQHFPVRKMDAGENAPPMHPNCRCSTAPWVDEEAYNAWLDAKASGEFEGGFDEWKNRNETPEEAAKPKEAPKPKDNDELSPDEMDALEHYVSGDGMWINQYLRGRGEFGELTDYEKEYLKDLKSATDRIVEIDKLFRSVDASAIFPGMDVYQYGELYNFLRWGPETKTQEDAFARLMKVIGETRVEKGFMSTTRNYSFASEFGDFTGSDMPVVLKIDTGGKARGVEIPKKLELEDDPQEEVLLKNGTEYTIKKMYVEDGNIVIDVKLKHK